MPSPQATPITLSNKQQTLLEQIARRSTNPYRLVRRAQLILAAAKGDPNSQIATSLQLSRSQVRFWRQRWLSAVDLLIAAEAEGMSDAGLTRRISEVLSDALRPGTPAQFSLEQIIQIVALACESPQESERPVSQWTPFELATEAVNRGIALADFSPQCGAFFKRKPPCNRTVIATGSMPILMTRLPLESKSGQSVNCTNRLWNYSPNTGFTWSVPMR